MDSRKIILLVGALVVAVVTALFARSLMAGAAAPQAMAGPVAAPVVVGPEVLVATRALPIGTILDASALRFQPWPKDLVDNAYYLKGQADLASLQGTVVRNPITAGQPVTQGALVKPGDRGFLAAALGAGMRAVTVPVTADTSAGGFIFPGDRVDLVLTQSVAGGGDGPPLKTSETFIRNIRVLATDKRVDHGTDENGKSQGTDYSSVTLEATPRIAEEIAVAQTVGTLSLSLRSLADTAGELQQAVRGAPIVTPAAPSDGAASYVTGADVSRFQRSSVPGRTEGGAPAAGGAPGTATPTGPQVRVARGNVMSTAIVAGGL